MNSSYRNDTWALRLHTQAAKMNDHKSVDLLQIQLFKRTLHQIKVEQNIHVTLSALKPGKFVIFFN